MALPGRKYIRLPHERYADTGAVASITVAVRERRPIFRDEHLAQIMVEAVLSTARDMGMPVYAFCVMPDHVHVLVGADFISARLQEDASPRAGIKPAPTSLIEFVKFMKGRSAASARRAGLMQQSFWQRSFFDHFLRRDEDIETVCRYIWDNPVRAGLVSYWKDYPYSGSTVYDLATMT